MALVDTMLALRGIGKSYGAIHALAGIDLDIAARDVIGICGDNGAGKSTLIRILSGAEQPSEGEISIDGQAIAIASPATALARGIATLYQDLALARHRDRRLGPLEGLGRDLALRLLGVEPLAVHWIFLLDQPSGLTLRSGPKGRVSKGGTSLDVAHPSRRRCAAPQDEVFATTCVR